MAPRKVFVQESKIGKGVFAGRPIAADEVVGAIRGKVTDDCDLDPHYCMHMDNDLFLLPRAPFRFLNHSCNPNAELFMWDDDEADPKTNTRTLYVGAKRKIREGQEITIDYGWPPELAIPCSCGSKKCRGYIIDADDVDDFAPLREKTKRSK